MKLKAIKALYRSIKKWESIVSGEGEDNGVINCSLCQSFPDSCKGCPVREKTKMLSCCGTPYDKWRDHQLKKHSNETHQKVYCPTCKRIAEDELNFLKSLVPGAIPI